MLKQMQRRVRSTAQQSSRMFASLLLSLPGHCCAGANRHMAADLILEHVEALALGKHLLPLSAADVGLIKCQLARECACH